MAKYATYLYSHVVTIPCCSELSTEVIGWSKAVTVPGRSTSRFSVHPAASYAREMDFSSSIRSFQSLASLGGCSVKIMFIKKFGKLLR